MLRNTGFLSHASPSLLRALEALATEVRVAPGACLFEQDDEGDAFYEVLDGELEISVLSDEGRKLSLCVMRPGECLGEISLFDTDVRTATATALSPTRLRRIGRVELHREIARDPELAVELLTLAGRRMRWMSTQIHEQVFLPLQTRLARRVLYLVGGEERNGRIAMSQAQIADFTGATREAVARTFSEWKRSGVIHVSRGAIKVADRGRLTAIAAASSF